MSDRAMDGQIGKWWTEGRWKHSAVIVEVNLMVPCYLVDSRQG